MWHAASKFELLRQIMPPRNESNAMRYAREFARSVAISTNLSLRFVSSTSQGDTSAWSRRADPGSRSHRVHQSEEHYTIAIARPYY
jgi:hypothetical protein